MWTQHKSPAAVTTGNLTRPALQDRRTKPKVVHITCHLGLEWTAHDVIGPTIFDTNQVVSRGHGSVHDFVPFWGFLAIHFDLGWSFNGDGECPWACLSGVDEEF